MRRNLTAVALLLLTTSTWAGSIDYSNPQQYLKPGTQSDIDDDTFQTLNGEVALTAEEKGTVEGIGKIASWIHNNFEPARDNSTIGKSTAKSLLASRKLSGCHDWALMLSALLRKFGYPAIMADAAGIQWARDFSAGTTRNFSGHVFVEVYVGTEWILVNSTGPEYLTGYTTTNQLIPIKISDQPKLWVLHKGLDPADYGVTNHEELLVGLRAFAKDVDHLSFPSGNGAIKTLPNWTAVK